MKHTNFPKTLLDRLQNGKIVPFVGAGVSLAVTHRETGKRIFPSWKELLENAALRLADESKNEYASLVRNLVNIGKPDYLEAARRARDELGPIWFDFLKEQFDRLHDVIEDTSLELAKSIWALESKLLITTNYDRVLHWACPERADLVYWAIQAPAEQAAAMRDGVTKHTVWHLHGFIDNSAEIILTPDGYERLYPENKDVEVKYAAALQTLQTLLVSHTLLFIGFSLEDEHFGLQLKGISEIFHGASGPHYALVREQEKEMVKSFNLPVEVISYEEHNRSLIETLREIKRISSGSSTRPESPVDQIGKHSVSIPLYDPHNYVFSVPFKQKGDQVVGRAAVLHNLREQLLRGCRTGIGQTAAFQGLGGLGKTQLAVEYAYLFKADYQNGVIWINADQDIDAQLTELADMARWVAPESEHKYKLDIARRRLKSYSGCLIIFDNLEKIETISDYLPLPSAEPHIIITSRTEQPGFIPLSLDLLSEDMSLKMLLQESGRESLADEEIVAIKAIADALEGLPLALEMAGAYLRHRKEITWQQYADLLQNNLKKALSERFVRAASFTKHEKDLYSTLKINEEVLNEEPRLREILDLLTWSGSASMGLPLMCALLGTQKAELSGALGLGTALRLLQKVKGTERYSLHRLVREVRREDIPLLTKIEWAKKICERMGDWFQQQREDFSSLPIFEAEFDHLVTWQRHSLEFARETSCRLLWLQSYPAYHRGDYKEAKKLLAFASSLFQQSPVYNRELQAHLFDDNGSLLSFLGDNKQAFEYKEKALAIRLELFGEKHSDTASSLNNVGITYGSLGDYKRALEYFDKALAIRLELFGEKHSDTASSLNNVGSVYGSLGDYKRELQYKEKALAIRLELSGEKHPNTAGTLNSVGIAFSRLGDYKRELEYKEKALAIYLELFGEKHPDTAGSLNSVGSAYGRLGDYKRELEYKEKALAIYLELFGEKHPDTAASLNNIGIAYGHNGDYNLMLEYTKKALAIYLELFGEKHPDTVASLHNLGAACGRSGDYKLELQHTEKALAICLEVFGEKHPSTALSLNSVGTSYGNSGDYKSMLEYTEKALAIRLEVFGEKHPDTAVSLDSVGSAYGRLGDYKRELECKEKALAIYSELLGEKHPDTIVSLNNVGIAFIKSFGYKKALPFLMKALSLHREIFGDHHPTTIDSVIQVSEILIQLKRFPQALMLLKDFLSLLPKDHPKYSSLLTKMRKIPGVRKLPNQ